MGKGSRRPRKLRLEGWRLSADPFLVVTTDAGRCTELEKDGTKHPSPVLAIDCVATTRVFGGGKFPCAVIDIGCHAHRPRFSGMGDCLCRKIASLGGNNRDLFANNAHDRGNNVHLSASDPRHCASNVDHLGNKRQEGVSIARSCALSEARIALWPDMIRSRGPGNLSPSRFDASPGAPVATRAASDALNSSMDAHERRSHAGIRALCPGKRRSYAPSGRSHTPRRAFDPPLRPFDPAIGALDRPAAPSNATRRAENPPKALLDARNVSNSPTVTTPGAGRTEGIGEKHRASRLERRPS